MTFEHAIADSESERSVELHTGYSNANANGRDSDDDDDDEEEADDLIAAEVRRRNEREGTTFVMNVKGGLNLIVV
jgi:hypothetical protein